MYSMPSNPTPNPIPSLETGSRTPAYTSTSLLPVRPTLSPTTPRPVPDQKLHVPTVPLTTIPVSESSLDVPRPDQEDESMDLDSNDPAILPPPKRDLDIPCAKVADVLTTTAPDQTANARPPSIDIDVDPAEESDDRNVDGPSIITIECDAKPRREAPSSVKPAHQSVDDTARAPQASSMATEESAPQTTTQDVQ